MRVHLYGVLIGGVIAVSACVPRASTSATSPSAVAGAGDQKCHEEAVTGSNISRTVCASAVRANDDRDQQIRDLRTPKADECPDVGCTPHPHFGPH